MKIVIVSATSFEIAPLLKHLEDHSKKSSFLDFQYNNTTIIPLVTGVGALQTAFAMARLKGMEEVDVVFNLGLAGTFKNHKLGEVVEVISDKFADLGVEEADGSFTDVFEMGLTDEAAYPYVNGWIENSKQKYTTGLKGVKGITVNKVHGTTASVESIETKYNPDVESMEGAGFFYASKMLDVHTHQIRAISNRVEKRNRENWKIQEAIDNLNEYFINFLDQIIHLETK